MALRGVDAFITRRDARSCMVTAADILPWIIAAVGWTLAGVGIFLARRSEKRERRIEEKLDSLIRANLPPRAIDVEMEGQVFDMGGGRTAEVVMLPNGRLGLNYILTPEPAVAKFTAGSATLKVSEKREEE